MIFSWFVGVIDASVKAFQIDIKDPKTVTVFITLKEIHFGIYILLI